MIKDFLCLPRPLSPPLQRITMSGLTALEYGFPSTHSTNAVSVALYCLTLLDASDHGLSSVYKALLQCTAWLYAASVVMGRIYCGMHGFLGTLLFLPKTNSLPDCIAGVLIGAALWWVKVAYGDNFDSFVMNGSVWAPIIVMSVTIFLIRIHPEPADACCKCFEDGVAFAGVFIGIKFAQWHNPISHMSHVADLPPAPAAIYLLKLTLKIVLGNHQIASG